MVISDHWVESAGKTLFPQRQLAMMGSLFKMFEQYRELVVPAKYLMRIIKTSAESHLQRLPPNAVRPSYADAENAFIFAPATSSSPWSRQKKTFDHCRYNCSTYSVFNRRPASPNSAFHLCSRRLHLAGTVLLGPFACPECVQTLN